MVTQTKADAGENRFVTAKERRQELIKQAEEYEAANDEVNAKQVEEMKEIQKKLDEHQAGVPAK